MSNSMETTSNGNTSDSDCSAFLNDFIILNRGPKHDTIENDTVEILTDPNSMVSIETQTERYCTIHGINSTCDCQNTQNLLVDKQNLRSSLEEEGFLNFKDNYFCQMVEPSTGIENDNNPIGFEENSPTSYLLKEVEFKDREETRKEEEMLRKAKSFESVDNSESWKESDDINDTTVDKNISPIQENQITSNKIFNKSNCNKSTTSEMSSKTKCTIKIQGLSIPIFQSGPNDVKIVNESNRNKSATFEKTGSKDKPKDVATKTKCTIKIKGLSIPIFQTRSNEAKIFKESSIVEKVSKEITKNAASQTSNPGFETGFKESRFDQSTVESMVFKEKPKDKAAQTELLPISVFQAGLNDLKIFNESSTVTTSFEEITKDTATQTSNPGFETGFKESIFKETTATQTESSDDMKIVDDSALNSSSMGFQIAGSGLPLKKRKCLTPMTEEEEEFSSMQEIIKKARKQDFDREISYPSKPMLSIACIPEAFGTCHSQPRPSRFFRTAAEKKETNHPYSGYQYSYSDPGPDGRANREPLVSPGANQYFSGLNPFEDFNPKTRRLDPSETARGQRSSARKTKRGLNL